MKVQILILFTALAVNQAQKLNDNSRIINYPYPPSQNVEVKHVAIFTKDQPNIPRCTGVKILRNWILTAASCVYDLTNLQISFKEGGTISASSAGTTHFESGLSVDLIKPHPSYSELNLAYDIALLRHSESLTKDGYVIERKNENWVQKSFIIRGYGGVDTTGVQTGDIQLNEARVVIQSNLDCRKDISNMPAYYKLCSIGSHLCVGDQGGPLISESTNKLVGIISTPGYLLNSCGRANHAETYTNVVNFIPWIEQVTGDRL